ncbi:MAG TPA: hypothetical protein VEI83_08695 [Acidimicrobiales bacterium]|nr:hypothetical protein [Acidimicrobiales bacterium]
MRSAASLEASGGPGSTPATLVHPPGIVLVPPSQLGASPVATIGSWELVARSADDRELLVSVGYGGCERLAALDVAVTAADVTITPRLRTAAPGTVCPAIAVAVRFLVDIGAPLGSRALLHPPPG